MADWNPSPIPETTSATPPTVSEESSTLRWIFLGRADSRRWRLLMYLVMCFLIGIAVVFILQRSRPPAGAAPLWAYPLVSS